MNRYSNHLKQALPGVLESVSEAAGRAGRDPGEIRLVAVTKAHPLEAVEAAVEIGLRDLGENRVEGLLSRVEDGSGRPLEWPGISWHMIGHVQSRKAAFLPGVADWIHSVDSLKLAKRLSAAAVDEVEALKVLVQVNTSGEGSKGGFPSGEALEAIHAISEMPDLSVEGLMTMAPFVDDEKILREAFSGLRELRDRSRTFPAFGVGELSMGMSNDYQLAIEEGSTMVRLGTVLFGRRP